MKPIRNVTVGADPEVFLLNRGSNIPRSAEGLFGGTKEKPKPMEGLPNGFFIQEDNVSAEFNIPPANSMNEFMTSIALALKYTAKIAAKNKCRLALVPDLDFPKDQLATKHAQTLGCDPDFNIWTETDNPRPVPPELMRTAAGHVHIGWEKPDWEQVSLVGRFFDVHVTLPSILVTDKNRRRELYGKAGACRPKKYGIECRAVDNFWLQKKGWIAHTYNAVMELVDELNLNAPIVGEMLADYSGMIVQAINNHDKEMAFDLCHRFGVKLYPGKYAD